MKNKTAIIIGAGPAGLTAAYELLERTDYLPIVLEKDTCLGGISRTVQYKGNRMDIGGHRFFSKSDRVMNWWFQHLPLDDSNGSGAVNRMLVRQRKSRIYFLRKFFDYPIRVNAQTIRNLGWKRVARIGASYARSAAFPGASPANLEQFLIQRFGRELYRTFFKSYTEKVWGIPCDQISPEWGEQRIKGLSIRQAILHFLRSARKGHAADVSQKNTETSLIEQFLYPKYGPGQMWEEVARKISERGGRILTGFDVRQFTLDGMRLTSVSGLDAEGSRRSFAGDLFFSSMPVRDLVRGLQTEVPEPVRQISEGLVYRDFLTVGLLLKKLKLRDGKSQKLIDDNWIYVQEPEVQVGRLQIFNNWSPYLVSDPSRVWLGAEYFCNEGDELWRMRDADLSALAARELHAIDVIEAADVLDSTVIRMPKAYPAYFGTYARFEELRQFLDTFPNLYLVGRNGMHRYNNQDHSMLAAMVAVDNIAAGREDKSNIWAINTETEYHEEKQTAAPECRQTQAAGASAD